MSPTNPGFRHPKRFRGDINAVLNRLIAEGVIGSYRTNLSEGGGPGNLEVTVTCPGVVDVGALRELVRQELAKLDEAAVVKVAAQ